MNQHELETVALEMSDAAKLNMVNAKDHYLLPVAFIIKQDDNMMIVGMPFKNEQDKAEKFAATSGIAKQENAQAVIILNDAYYREMPGAYEALHYQRPPGGMGKDLESREAICISVMGPNFKTRSCMIPYARVENELIFHTPLAWTESTINIFPEWWTAHAQEKA